MKKQGEEPREKRDERKREGRQVKTATDKNDIQTYRPPQYIWVVVKGG